MKGRDNLGDMGVDGKIILKCILNKLGEDVDWIHLIQNRVQWRALGNIVMNLWNS
jgi:hypothetical protein